MDQVARQPDHPVMRAESANGNRLQMLPVDSADRRRASARTGQSIGAGLWAVSYRPRPFKTAMEVLDEQRS